MEIPQSVLDRKKELNEICTKYPKSIPLEVAANYIDADADSVRNSIDQGKCPFGIGWTSGPRNIRYNKIPMLKFYLWASNST